jgi:hypothetical protein
MYTKELKWTNEEIEILKNNYQSMTYDELSYLINKKAKAIGTKAQRLGLIKQPPPRYNINQHCFDKLDKDIAYILGFIITDGCISNNRLEIHINRKDRYLLENIRDKLDSQIPVLDHEFYDKRLKRQIYSSRLLLNSVYICKNLEKYGIIPNKSDKQEVRNIPSKYKYHYLRGAFDGNGWFGSSGSFHIVSFKSKFLEQLQEFTFPEYGKIKFKENTHNGVYEWSVYQQDQVKEIHRNIYKNCGNLYLTRKSKL